MINHETVTSKQRLAAQLELLKAEKELTRLSDEIARRRRELPWIQIDKKYLFETDEGSATLEDLFNGRSQLVVYHFMLGPDYTAGCPACSATADSFNGVLPHLEACDVTMISISRAPLEKLLAYRQRMGWTFNWASSYGSDFNFDFGVSAAEFPDGDLPPAGAGEVAASRLAGDKQFRDSLPPIVAQNAGATGTDIADYLSEGHGVSVFSREGDVVYHCYSSYNRGTEFLMSHYAILDRVPKGRNESGSMGTWLRRHDEYGTNPSSNCCH
jgi:predicted dithiol-disulfide oxidoreductase (DUF899 family)